MAKDLLFWTDVRSVRPKPKAIYADLMNGQHVDRLAQFDASAVLDAIAEHFSGLVTAPASTAGHAAWGAPDGRAVFEFSWSPQHLVATAPGRYTMTK